MKASYVFCLCYFCKYFPWSVSCLFCVATSQNGDNFVSVPLWRVNVLPTWEKSDTADDYFHQCQKYLCTWLPWGKWIQREQMTHLNTQVGGNNSKNFCQPFLNICRNDMVYLICALSCDRWGRAWILHVSTVLRAAQGIHCSIGFHKPPEIGYSENLLWACNF